MTTFTISPENNITAWTGRPGARDGTEVFDVTGLEGGVKPRQQVTLTVHRANGESESVPLILRIDTPIEIDYYQHGGILPYVLRQIVAKN